MKKTLSSSDPKAVLKQNFKDEMKQYGIQNDVKVLKGFKTALLSRSQDQLNQEISNANSVNRKKKHNFENQNDELSGIGRKSKFVGEDDDDEPELEDEDEGLFSRAAATIPESESTTLNRHSLLKRADESLRKSRLSTLKKQSTIKAEEKDEEEQSTFSRFILPFKRRILQRMRSASPPKPNLQICTDNYIVYS